MNWLDALIAGLVVLSALLGFREGFTRMAARIGGLILALVLSPRLAGPLANWLDNQFDLVHRLTGFFARHLRLPSDMLGLDLATTPPAEILDRLGFLRLVPGLEMALGRFLDESLATAVAAGQTNVSLFVYEGLSRILLVVACFFVLFSLIRCIVAALTLLIGAPLYIGGVDRLLGAGLGALQSAVVLAVILGLLAPWLALPALGGLHESVVSSSYAPWLIQRFYDYSTFIYAFRPPIPEIPAALAPGRN